MADEDHGQIGVRVERWLERKQGQQQVRRTADAVNAAAPPSINRRADVVDGRHPGTFQRTFQQQVEDIEVHTDEQVHRLFQELAAQAPPQAQQARQLDERVLEAVDGQCVQFRPSLQPGAKHGPAANADEAGPIEAGGQRPHQPRRQPVTRRLPRHQADPVPHGSAGKPSRDWADRGAWPLTAASTAWLTAG